MLGKIAGTFNEIVSTNQHIAQQLEHVGQVVGKDGRTRQRLRIGLATRSWGEMENSVNALIDDLLWPTAEVTRSIEAVAWGDLLLPFALPECATSTEIASLEHVGSRVLIVEDEALVWWFRSSPASRGWVGWRTSEPEPH